VEKILPFHLFSSSKVYFVSPQWITQVKLMSRRNVQIHCIYSPLYSTLKSISCRGVFKYMGVYVPTVFVQIFKHIYNVHAWQQGCLRSYQSSELPIFKWTVSRDEIGGKWWGWKGHVGPKMLKQNLPMNTSPQSSKTLRKSPAAFEFASWN
jgi:hypothetical protein